jgi:hypothetical protein
MFMFAGNFLFYPLPAAAEPHITNLVKGEDAQHFAIQGEWINRGKINITRIEFLDSEFLLPDFKDRRTEINEALAKNARGEYVDDNISDGAHEFFKDTGCGDAGDRSKFVLNIRGGVSDLNPEPNEALISNQDLHVPLRDSCGPVMAPEHLGGGIPGAGDRNIFFVPDQPDRRYLWFIATTPTTLIRVDGKKGTFTKDGTSNIYISERGSCTVRVEFVGAPKTNPGELTDGFHETCDGGQIFNGATIARPAKTMLNTEGQNTGVDANALVPKSCESENGSVILGWMICGLINAMDGMVSKSTELVNNLLDVNAEDFANSIQLRAVWSLFRAIATFSLVGVALVMIISQAVGGGQ